MITYNYIGCDVSKQALDCFDPRSSSFSRIGNDAASVGKFVAGLEPGRDFVVMEATGVHDRLLRHELAKAGIAYTRKNPMQTRRFAQASGRLAKTDRIDTRTLSHYGECLRPAPDEPPCAARERLAALSRRRDQLVEARADEKKHLGEAFEVDVIADIEGTIADLSRRIAHIEKTIAEAVKGADATTAAAYDILVSAPGVSTVTAIVLMAHLPELGHRSPKTIAALAGLAPFNDDSGRRKGHRSIAGGRARVRRALYMASLSAIGKCPRLKSFFERIVERSGSRKLAIIAVGRKLLTMLNAMLRDQTPFHA